MAARGPREPNASIRRGRPCALRSTAYDPFAVRTYRPAPQGTDNDRSCPGNRALPGRSRQALLPDLKALVDATRQGDGCIAYDVGEDPFEPGLFRFSELWPDQATLSAHLTAPHIAPWREACRKHGMIERRLQVFDVSNPRPL